MARYLTPSKIGLLVLIELYVEGAVPSEAILPVLSFITSHLMERDPVGPATAEPSVRWERAERAVSLVISIKDFEKLLGSYPFLMGMLGKKLWDQFLAKLWALDSLDGMNLFLENLPKMLAKPKRERRHEDQSQSSESDDENVVKLSRTSPFGYLIRKSKVEFTRLKWHESTRLWQDFVRYRQPTAHYMRRKNPLEFGRLSFDCVLQAGDNEDWEPGKAMDLASVAYGDMLSGDHTSTLPVSNDDIELLLEFQIEQMQKYGNRVPPEIRHQFLDLLHDSYTIPSLTHYLHFLESWRAGDYPSAFDQLHRYFDYTVQSRDQFFYQYALMNLAVLQAEFGCFRDALTTMLETVSTARENRDNTCLNFALNWLYHFGRCHPDLVRSLESKSLLGSGKETLAYLRVKSKETGMWMLWSSVLLSEAKLALINGDSIATALEFLVRSSQVIISRNMRNMFGSQLSLSSSLWDRLGLGSMATLAQEIFLRCHVSHSVFDDELKVTSRLALGLAAQGQYDEALSRLESMDGGGLRSWKPNQHWHRCMGLIKLRRDLHRNDLENADQLLDQLIQSKHDDMDPDGGVLIDIMEIDMLTRIGDLQKAFRKANVILARLRGEGKDLALRVRIMLCKVALLDKCGRPQRGFTMAMQAASIAWRARLMPLLWQAIGAVSNILVSLGEFEAASQLLYAVIPRALECEMGEVNGTLYSVLADANVGLAGKCEEESKERLEYLTRAMGAVGEAFVHFSGMEDLVRKREMTAKKAVIMQLSGDMELAAGYAATYVSLQDGYEEEAEEEGEKEKT